MLEKFEKAGSAFIGIGILWYAQDQLFKGNLKEVISSTVSAVGKVGEFVFNAAAFAIQHPEFGCLGIGTLALSAYLLSLRGQQGS